MKQTCQPLTVVGPAVPLASFCDAHGIYRPMPGRFYLYVADADGVYTRALLARRRSSLGTV